MILNKVFRNAKFDGLFDDGGLSISDCEFNNCQILSGGLALDDTKFLSTKITRCKANGIEISSCVIGSAVFSECVIDRLASRDGLIQIFGAAFDRVIIRGKCGRLMIRGELSDDSLNAEAVNRHAQTLAKFYLNVPFAIDVSSAQFDELDIEGVPPHLIIR